NTVGPWVRTEIRVECPVFLQDHDDVLDLVDPRRSRCQNGRSTGRCLLRLHGRGERHADDQRRHSASRQAQAESHPTLQTLQEMSAHVGRAVPWSQGLADRKAEQPPLGNACENAELAGNAAGAIAENAAYLLRPMVPIRSWFSRGP